MPLESYGNLLQHFTGSKAHNVRMREDAQRRGLSISEWGITDIESGTVYRTADEDEVYRHLGYQPIPPELREDTGELELARKDELPGLVELADIRGDLHLHSDGASDGSIAARSSRPCGSAATSTWRSPTTPAASAWASASSPTTCPAIDAVHRVRATLRRLRPAGGLRGRRDERRLALSPDDVMAELDWVVASLHVAQRQGADRITTRLIAAAEHPYVDVIGHPSGRLIGTRERLRLRSRGGRRGLRRPRHVPRDQFEAAPARSPSRARAPRDRCGRRLVVSTDAHRLSAMDFQELGVFMARRAGATRDDIVNARPLAELAELRKPGRVAQT